MLSRRVRLRSGRDFRAVYGRCRTVSSTNLVLSVRHWKNGRSRTDGVTEPVVRFGFSISKKTAKRAHDRNKIKRRLREIVRLRILPALKPYIDCDVILSVRPPALTLDFELLAKDVLVLFHDSGLLRDES